MSRDGRPYSPALLLSTTHVAGAPLLVRADGRVIQRCGLCGEAMADSLPPPAPAEWYAAAAEPFAEGAVVRFQPGRPPLVLGVYADDVPAVGDFCYPVLAGY